MNEEDGVWCWISSSISDTEVFLTAELPLEVLQLGVSERIKPNTHRRRDETVESRRRCEHTRRQSWPSLQFPVLTTDKWRHDDVIVEKNCTNWRILHYTADSNVYKHAASYVTSYYSIGCRIVNWVTADGCVHIAESVGSRREFIYTPPTRRDKTVSSRRRRRCVLGLTNTLTNERKRTNIQTNKHGGSHYLLAEVIIVGS